MIRLLSGDCRDVLATLPAESVQCVVTSPPYWNLRDYGTALWDGGDANCQHTFARHDSRLMFGSNGTLGKNCTSWTHRDATPPRQCACGAVRVDRQIGLEASPDEYLATMVGVFREVRRVLRKDGTLWLNVGSSYASSDQSRRRGRALACDNGSTAPRGSPAPDCAYPDLDGEQSGGFLSHRDRSVDSDRQPARVPAPSDETDQSRLTLAYSDTLMPRPDVLASTIPSSSANGQGAFGLEAMASVAHSIDPTLLGAVHQSSDSSASPFSSRSSSAVSQDRPPNTPYSEETDGSLASRIAGKGAGSASCDCGSCGICFAYSAIPMLQFKAKDLMMMPELLALALQADGWYIRSSIIWHKPNPMPESVTDRPTSAHEHVFLLTRSSRYYYDADAVREAHAEPDRGKGEMERNNWSVGCDRGSKPMVREYNPAGRNLRNVWTIATHAYPDAHFATFPPELAERCIRAGTSERGCCVVCGKPWVRETERAIVPLQAANNPVVRDAGVRTTMPRCNVDATTTGWSPGCQCNAAVVPCVVLDPFAGAGTTLLVADRLQRDAVGIELNTQYTEMAMERCRRDAPLFTSFPPAEPPEDMRMGDLFAGDEYERPAPAPKPQQVPRGWDTGPGAHGTIHRTGRTITGMAAD